MGLEIKLNSNQKLENLKKQIHNNEFLKNHIIICTLQPQGTVTTAPNSK